MAPDASPGGPIQFGDDDAGHTDRLGEGPGLGDGILPAGPVQHQQDFVHTARLPLQHPHHLAQFLHQVVLGMEPPGGVDDHDPLPPGPPGSQGIEGHRRRVGARLP